MKRVKKESLELQSSPLTATRSCRRGRRGSLDGLHGEWPRLPVIWAATSPACRGCPADLGKSLEKPILTGFINKEI